MTAALAVSHLTTRLAGRVVVNDVSLSFQSGSLIALVGRNGAGKSTFLRAIAGLLPYQGEIAVGGQIVKTLSRRERARAVAYLPQGGRAFWPLSVREIVALGRTPYGATLHRLSAADREAVDAALSALDLHSLAEAPATRLSGGELARALLARALAVRAPLLLADEPVAALDPAYQLTAMEALSAEASGGRCVIAVMHDLSLAMRFAQRFILFDQGRVVADGAPLNLMESGAIGRAFGLSFIVDQKDGVPFVAPGARIQPEA